MVVLGFVCAKESESKGKRAGEMEANYSSVSDNGNKGFVGDVEEEDLEILKRRISSHPLYGLLIETHLNCLKVGSGEVGDVDTTNDIESNLANLQATIPSSSELDRFMEAYCVTLNKLKQAMEEPSKDTETFIDAMHVQLRELCETETHRPNNPKTNSLASA